MPFASPVVPLVNVTRHGSSGASSTAGAGSEPSSAGSGTSSTSQSGPAADSSTALRSSAITRRGVAASRRARRSPARSCSLQGSTTAPIRKQATIASTHCGRLPISVSTTSPRPTPRPVSVPASRAEASATSPNVNSRRRPSRASSTIARASAGAASTTSRAKFIGGVCRTPPGRGRLDREARDDHNWSNVRNESAPAGRPITILMADDDEDDRDLTRDDPENTECVEQMEFVRDGPYAESGSPAARPEPSIILLDLNMPRKDGREALAEIKSDRELRHIPVVVLTTSSDAVDVRSAYDLGANSYITKPVTGAGLEAALGRLAEYWSAVVTLPGAV